MANNPELDARCDYAMFKIIGLEKSDARASALRAAKACGYRAYPATRVSPYFADEPELLAAHQEGWAEHAYDDRPLTKEDLAATIKKIDSQANAGCGLFYELYEQNFTHAVRAWLPKLRESERVMALELLKMTVYSPEETGTWTYDPEENDVTYTAGED